MSSTKVDLDEALASVSPRVKRAFELSHEALLDLDIPHVLIGGLAVNAMGYPYSTKDVDYLVSEKEAFDGDVVLSHKPGVPFQVDGVPIDYVVADAKMPLQIRAAITNVIGAARAQPSKLVLVQDWLLVYLKLNAGRTKDLAAVEGLILAGLDVDSVRAQLQATGDDRVLGLFDRCVERAR